MWVELIHVQRSWQMMPNPRIPLAAEHSIWKWSYLPSSFCSMLIFMTTHCDIRETYGFAWRKKQKVIINLPISHRDYQKTVVSETDLQEWTLLSVVEVVPLTCCTTHLKSSSKPLHSSFHFFQLSVRRSYWDRSGSFVHMRMWLQ